MLRSCIASFYFVDGETTKTHKIEYVVSKISKFLHPLRTTAVVQIHLVFWDLWLLPPFHIIIKSITVVSCLC